MPLLAVTFLGWRRDNTLPVRKIRLLFSGACVPARTDQNDCAENNSLTRGLAGTRHVVGLRYGRRQRLEPPRPERRRALSLLPLRSPDAGAVISRTVDHIAKAGRFLAAPARFASGHGS